MIIIISRFYDKKNDMIIDKKLDPVPSLDALHTYKYHT